MDPKVLGTLAVGFLIVVLLWPADRFKGSNNFSERNYRLNVVNVTFKELLLFEDALQKRLPAVHNVERQHFDQAEKIAEIEVTIIGDSQLFVNELTWMEFDGFEVEVLNWSKQSLDVQIKQK